MKRRRRSRTILLVVLLVLVGIQFLPVDRSVPDYDESGDFITMVSPPQDVRIILEVACYDCHSYESRYPWYAYIQPFSGWIQSSHIDHGREELNFSTWGSYDFGRQDHKLEECAELVGNSSMPLSSYLWMHGDARLTDDQRDRMAEWFEGQRTGMGD